MKIRYVVEVDFHPGTAALRRIAQMFSLLGDIYGVRSLTYEVVPGEEEHEVQGPR